MTIKFEAKLNREEVAEIVLANLPEGIPIPPKGYHFAIVMERYPDITAMITLEEDEVPEEIVTDAAMDARAVVEAAFER